MSDAPSAWQGDLDRDDLNEDAVPAHPLALFGHWYEAARGCGLKEPSAMTLATIDPDGRPSARISVGFDTFSS